MEAPNTHTEEPRPCDGLAALVLIPNAKAERSMPRRGDRLGYIDVHGHFVIPTKYRFTHACDARFTDDLAAVVPGYAFLLNYGYINRDGQWAIGPQFQNAEPFRDGKASVTVGQRGFNKSIATVQPA